MVMGSGNGNRGSTLVVGESMGGLASGVAVHPGTNSGRL